MQLSKKKKFVKDGVFKAEVNELLSTMLAEDGYSGLQMRMTPVKATIIIRATRPREVLGVQGRRIRELTSMVEKRFAFKAGTVELLAERVENRGLSPLAQAESLRYKLLRGLPVRRACYGVLRTVMDAGAMGCEVIVAGKIRVQRAKAMKFKEGFMIAKGHPASIYIQQAVRTVQLRQGILGVKVKIMLPHDPQGKDGPTIPLPDNVIVKEPKEIADPTAQPLKSFVYSYKAAPAPMQPVPDMAQQQTEMPAQAQPLPAA